ncbi:MAG TPA: hypothetical protein VGM33_12085 [Baekduia sp.]|jgi:hypothetical protein
MLLLPLRRAPMMLGGVGFQSGLDQVQRERVAARRQAAQAAQQAAAGKTDVVAQLKDLMALQEAGVLSPDEFQLAKRKILAG